MGGKVNVPQSMSVKNQLRSHQEQANAAPFVRCKLWEFRETKLALLIYTSGTPSSAESTILG